MRKLTNDSVTKKKESTLGRTIKINRGIQESVGLALWLSSFGASLRASRAHCSKVNIFPLLLPPVLLSQLWDLQPKVTQNSGEAPGAIQSPAWVNQQPRAQGNSSWPQARSALMLATTSLQTPSLSTSFTIPVCVQNIFYLCFKQDLFSHLVCMRKQRREKLVKMAYFIQARIISFRSQVKYRLTLLAENLPDGTLFLWKLHISNCFLPSTTKDQQQR